MKIYVGGSLRDGPVDAELCRKFIEQLGAKIAEHGHILLTGCRGSLDQAIAESANNWLEQNGQVVFRYVNAAGEIDPAHDPNGSMRGIAGIINERGNVLGLMPHPERAAETVVGSADGVALFESLLAQVGV